MREIIYSAEIKQNKRDINFLFSCDGGAFGTDEILDEISVTYYDLLKVLQKHEEEKDEYLEFSYLLTGEKLRSEKKLKEFLKTDLPKNLCEFGMFVCGDAVYVKKELELFINER